MNDLQHLANLYMLSIESLRRFAFNSCGIPEDASQELVDLWLYERLAMAAHAKGCHFHAHSDQSLHNAIAYSLSWPELAGSFEEKCAASWAELLANPIIRHEIALPKPEPLFGSPADRKFCDPLWYLESDRGGAVHEGFGDSIAPLAYIETANQPPTDPA